MKIKPIPIKRPLPHKDIILKNSITLTVNDSCKFCWYVNEYVNNEFLYIISNNIIINKAERRTKFGTKFERNDARK